MGRTSTPQPNNLHRSHTNSTPLQQVPIHTTTHPKMSNPGNIVGGHKANLNNPNTSEESKQHSRDVLNNEFNGGDVESASDQGKNPNNVAGGLRLRSTTRTFPRRRRRTRRQG